MAQLNFIPAATLSEVSLLAQPYGIDEPWCVVPAKPNFREIRRRRRDLGIRLREVYCAQITAKLAAIAEHCSKWHCDLLVLPEYSAPPESISTLMAAAGAMTSVLGTHYVEAARTRTTFYPDLGISAPAPGHALALISAGGAIVGTQLKMQRSRWEQELHVSSEWNSVPLARNGRRLGVLICLDFISDRNEAFVKSVLPKLHDVSLLAVPSLTPSGSRKEFEAALKSEAQRQGRPVAYANTAAGGGTTVYIEGANSPEEFPFGIPSLEQGQEGVVVVDVDLELNRPRDSRGTRYDHRTVAQPIAAAQLIYLSGERGAEHHTCLSEIVQEGSNHELNSLVDSVNLHSGRLESSAAGLGSQVSSRIVGLLDKINDIDDAERVLCRLRDVFMPPHVLPPHYLRQLMIEGAVRETEQWGGDPEVAKFVAECRSQLQAAKNGIL